MALVGVPDKVDQNKSDCTVYSGRFLFSFRGKCPFSRQVEFRVTGSLSLSLIDRVFGRVRLTDPKIIQTSPGQQPKQLGGQVPDILASLRNRLIAVGQKLLPEPEAGLVLGIVLGFKDRLPVNFYDKLVNSGTIHIIVASGYNVMIVGNFILVILLVWLKRPWATVLTILGMVFYAALAGGEPPGIRAVIMAAVELVGLALGRTASSVWALYLTLALMLLVEPALIGSISFQLSAAAAMGIFGLKPVLEKVVQSHLEGSIVVEMLIKTELLSTLAATIFTAPIIIYHFQRLSLVGIVSNVLILPIVPVLMGWGSVMLLVGLVIPAPLVSYPTYGLAHLVVMLIEAFGGL